jgi:ionotropic glutamate receptor
MHDLSTIPQVLTRICLLCFLLIPFVLIHGIQGETMNLDKKVISIGVIVDGDSRIGKEQEVAMDIAAKSYNNTSKNHKLALYFRNSTKDTLTAITLG